MAELRNISWSRLVKDLWKYKEPILKSRSLQWWLTVGLRQQGYILLDKEDCKPENDLVIEYRGVRFIPDKLNYPRMFEAWDRYRIDALQKSDRVLDLGANIGSYTIPAAQRVDQVVAVEPIFYEELEENLGLSSYNSIVETLENSVGSKEVDCQEYRRWAARLDLEDIIEDLKPTVVRMDIGGAESVLFPDMFGKPRIWELEFHFPNKSLNLNMWFNWFKEKGYGWIARWSKSKHWLYISADKDLKVQKIYHLKDGSFKGDSLKMWKGEL